MSVAIVHDYLTQRGGAERVVLSMLRAWPGAPVHTSLFEPLSTFEEFREADVRPMRLNNVKPLRQNHRLAFPVLASAFSRLRINADVVVCSSSGWAHGALTEGRKVVFCYTPARWLYQPDRYLGEGNPAVRTVLAAASPSLRKWDRNAAFRADKYIAISTVVRERIRAAYGIEAQVLTPPQTIKTEGARTAVAGLEEGFFLCICRLLPYKNVDAVVEAFTHLPQERLVVVGTGPEDRTLRQKAPSNVSFTGTVSEEELRWLYANCCAIVSASYEDLGLTPLEAAAFGKPSAVIRWGGFLDTVIEGSNGLFFEEPDPRCISETLARMPSAGFDPEYLRAHAAAFSEDVFIEALRAVVADVAAQSPS